MAFVMVWQLMSNLIFYINDMSKWRLPEYETVTDYIYDAARAFPQNIAVSFNNVSITYRELNERSNQLAHYLLQRGLKPGQPVALVLERSPEIIIALLAILKCGACYVPMDPNYPKDRVIFMVEDAAALFYITDQKFTGRFAGSGTNEILLNAISAELDKCSDADLPRLNNRDAIAYILYTSGSTGKPKGAMVTHGNLIHFLKGMQEVFNITSGDKFLSVSSISFDASCFDNYLSLIHGAELVLADNEAAKSGDLLLKLIADKKVSIMLATPVTYKLMLNAGWEDKIDITVLSAGEPLPATLARDLIPRCKSLYNVYGPTETTVICILAQISDYNKITIGKPIQGTPVYFLDENLKPVAANEIGEIYIGGAGVSKGYLNRPELTSEKFIKDPFSTAENAVMYKSGDLGKLEADGNISYHGRVDNQVKIRGFRIELGEIEHQLSLQTTVKEAVVVPKENKAGELFLSAYVTLKHQIDKKAHPMLITGWRTGLRTSLPEFMVPEHFTIMEALPISPNGKIDKNALPYPSKDRPELLNIFEAPRSDIEKNIAGVWSQILEISPIGTSDNFFELGGNSLLAQKTVSSLKEKFHYDIPITKLYQYPTIAGLQHILKGNQPEKLKHRSGVKHTGKEGIAIIGMSGRFPGADSIEEYWEVLKNAKETITFFAENEIDPSIPPSVKDDSAYVRARGILKDIEEFDADLFGITPRLAELMDPQQRVFLEVARDLLEKTGMLKQNKDEVIGVFAGCNTNTYFYNNVLHYKDKMEHQGYYQTLSVTEKDYLATRTAYHLNLRGPAVSVNSACSTSLLAVAQAVESLRRGQCDAAIAGGVAINVPVNSGHIYQEGSMLSADGHSRPFDANARGTVFSDGAGAVLLKRLEDAEADGDTIYAVIKGVGVNNDGGEKGSFTSPSTSGQFAAITMAIDDAGIKPSEISYVETHGTATPLGDPIEIEGLRMAFGDQGRKQYCAIGSVKSNIGHLTHAAGAAGLIKTTLSLYHQQLVPSINYTAPNPTIDFENSPFFVNTQLRNWDVPVKRIAGVSSFGVGGTNVHIIVEEYPNSSQINIEDSSAQIIAWSARSENSSGAYADKLTDYIKSNKHRNLADIAYTLQHTKQSFSVRTALVARDMDDLLLQLSDTSRVSLHSFILKERNKQLILVFPGQGSQYINMGKALYDKEPVYKEAIDKCAEILNEELGEDIRKVIFTSESDEAAEKLKNTFYTQPAIFITSYAIAKLYLSLGLVPDAMIGHSVGEFVAAHLAGVFSLQDVLKLVAARARLISELPGGTMLSVRAGKDVVLPLLPGSLSLAANNAPNLCVVAGVTGDIEHFSELLAQKKIPNKLLRTSHAFHSRMMDAMVQPLEKVVSSLKLEIPKIPVLSTVTGGWLKDGEATDPVYWAKHARKTVNFSDAVSAIATDLSPVYLECGPGNTATTLIKQHGGKIAENAFNSIDAASKNSEEVAVRETLSKLWTHGIELNWSLLHKGNTANLLHDIPTYAYDKKRYWLDAVIDAPFGINKKNDMVQVSVPVKTELKTDIPMRKDKLIKQLKDILEEASGIDIADANPHANFVELGLDSLLLTQIAASFKKEFKCPVTFRQLSEELDTLDKLATYLDANLPKDPENVQPSSQQIQATPVINSPVSNGMDIGNTTALGLISQQISLLSQQVMLLQSGTGLKQPVNTVPSAPASSFETRQSNIAGADISAEEQAELKKPFGAIARIEKKSNEINEKQTEYVNELISKYNAKTVGSKNYTQKYRQQMADPRVVSGFKPLTKEMIYSIVINKSKGCYLWDIDGNKYIDALNGFGSNFLGYQADVLKNALIEQAEKGYEVGPQHELAGPVCSLVCELIGSDRAALCNTGSEAILGAMRIARTVTNRDLIVAFSGSYHGIIDEVLVRGTKKLKTFPAASGILGSNVQNMLILDYGTDEALEIIKERSNDIAGILVETVQSRRPEFQPVEFLKKLRKLTEEKSIALIFDEVITGFRCHPGGVQALFGIKADLATYGKVAGGGLSIGIIAGKKQYMDALDGGFWEYGNNSVPEVGVTYFAGTFVRHPLALATAYASLNYIKEQGPELQKGLNRATADMVERLNNICTKYKTPLYVASFSSLWKVKQKEEYPYQELLFTLMRLKGIHIWDGFPCFLTAAHTAEDMNSIVSIFEESIVELCDVGFIPQAESSTASSNGAGIKIIDNSTPPVAGARLGKDKSGNPAWFVPDGDNPGKYLQISLDEK
ncbi:MAG: amino acid adenylation domain-containing protein [Niabella sp.]